MLKSNRFAAFKVCGVAITMGVMIAGCQSSSPPPAYPINSEPMTPPPAPAEMIPAGATPLASGAYSTILFKMPDQQGMLYIVDKDTKEIKGRTNAATPGESMTMADLKNVTQPLDSTHTYQIWFVPTVATTAPVKP